MRSLLQRLHPLDVALGAVLLLAVVFLLATVPGYRWSSETGSGLLRERRATVTLAVRDELHAAIVRELQPGPLEAETPRGRVTIEVKSVEPSGGGARVVLAVTAVSDRGGRVFWNDARLRRGDGLRVSTSDRTFQGIILAVALEGP